MIRAKLAKSKYVNVDHHKEAKYLYVCFSAVKQHDTCLLLFKISYKKIKYRLNAGNLQMDA